MSVPGLSVLNCSPMSVNAFFNDAAAKTMSFPPPVVLAEDGDDVWFDELHPLTMPSSSTAAAASRPRCSRLSSRGFHDHGGGFNDGHGHTARLQLQFARGFGTHQGYDGERPALHLTCAITLSATTLVTKPVNRLRAELATLSGSLGTAPECATSN